MLHSNALYAANSRSSNGGSTYGQSYRNSGEAWPRRSSLLSTWTPLQLLEAGVQQLSLLLGNSLPAGPQRKAARPGRELMRQGARTGAPHQQLPPSMTRGLCAWALRLASGLVAAGLHGPCGSWLGVDLLGTTAGSHGFNPDGRAAAAQSARNQAACTGPSASATSSGAYRHRARPPTSFVQTSGTQLTRVGFASDEDAEDEPGDVPKAGGWGSQAARSTIMAARTQPLPCAKASAPWSVAGPATSSQQQRLPARTGQQQRLSPVAASAGGTTRLAAQRMAAHQDAVASAPAFTAGACGGTARRGAPQAGGILAAAALANDLGPMPAVAAGGTPQVQPAGCPSAGAAVCQHQTSAPVPTSAAASTPFQGGEALATLRNRCCNLARASPASGETVRPAPATGSHPRTPAAFTAAVGPWAGVRASPLRPDGASHGPPGGATLPSPADGSSPCLPVPPLVPNRTGRQVEGGWRAGRGSDVGARRQLSGTGAAASDQDDVLRRPAAFAARACRQLLESAAQAALVPSDCTDNAGIMAALVHGTTLGTPASAAGTTTAAADATTPSAILSPSAATGCDNTANGGSGATTPLPYGHGRPSKPAASAAPAAAVAACSPLSRRSSCCGRSIRSTAAGSTGGEADSYSGRGPGYLRQTASSAAKTR